MRAPSKRTLLVGAVMVAVAAALIAWLAETRRRHYVQVGKISAVQTVGLAAIDYLRQTGVPPRDIGVLFEAGFLCSDEQAWPWVDSCPPGAYKGCPAEYVNDVQLQFPASTEGYCLSESTVVRCDTREPLIVATAAGVPPNWIAVTNQSLARDWYLAMAELGAGSEPATQKPSANSQPTASTHTEE